MRDTSEMRQIFSRYDGWRMVYVSDIRRGTGLERPELFVSNDRRSKKGMRV